MPRRLLFLACALVVLALAGWHHASSDRPADRHADRADRLATAQIQPDPALAAVITDATVVAPTAPTPIASGWARHLRPADTAIIVSHAAARPVPDAAGPLTFPLLI
ncbi:MAG: hypothetical protein ABS36_10885 [Acidobacteria bacterium SCN 69-37]|nr:MAG: hypothetical protein ABS36_10885 [Acidobacteria bacterium SCN 69-37]